MIHKKNNGISLTNLYIVTFVLCLTQFFGFYRYVPFFKEMHSIDAMNIEILIITFFFLIIRLISMGVKISFKTFFLKENLMLLLLIIIEIVMSFNNYGQPIAVTLKESFYYFNAIIVYFCLSIIFTKKADLDYLIEVLVKFSLISSIISLISFIFFTYFNVNILSLEIYEGAFRNGTLRFSIGGIVLYLGFLMSASKVMDNKYNKIDMLNIMFFLVQMIVISKTRTVILYCIATCLIYYFILGNFQKKNKVLIIWLIVTSLIWILYNDLFENINKLLSTDVSISIRFKTIDFYMSQFFENPLLGMGFISASKDINGWQLLYGSEGYYYRSDVGIIGFLNQFGLLGIIWLLLFFIKIVKLMKRHKKTPNLISSRNKIIIILIFLIISMINLIFTDSNRMMYLPVLMIFVEKFALEANEERKLL